jgi:hypothetical protein
MLAAKMEQGADKAVAAFSVIIRAARPMAVVGKELEHQIEQLDCFCGIHVSHALIAPDPG